MKPLQEFLSTSTIHGLSHIASAKSWAVRIVWIIVVALGFSAAIYLISNSYTEWTESPVSSTTITRPISELDFPDVTVCPPKESNTVLNLVVDKLKDEKTDRTERLLGNLKKIVQKTFLENPSKAFAKDMTHMMNIQSLADVAKETVKIPAQNWNNSAGENEILIMSNSSKGIFSTPGYNDVEYQGNFYKTSNLINFQLDISSSQSDQDSLVVEVDVREGVEWRYRKQVNRLRLYTEKKNFEEAEQFCVNKGGHLASVGSAEIAQEVLKASNGVSVWLGGTDKAKENNWIWTDGTPFRYRKWGKQQPNNGNKAGVSSMFLPGETKENCLTQEEDEWWHDVPCSRELPFICAVEPKAEVGPKRITFNGSNIELWWKHSSSGENTETSKATGFRISWQLENSDRQVDASKTTTENESEFWDDFLAPWNVANLETSNTTWHEAELICRRDGGHLLSVRSETEKKKLEDETLKDQYNQDKIFWLGGTDKEEEGTWRWSDGKTWNDKDVHWATRVYGVGNEPDGKEGENCLVWFEFWVAPLILRGHGWGDLDCEDEYNQVAGFVCSRATPRSNFGTLARLVHQSLEQGRDLTHLWKVILKHRWTADILNTTKESAFCLDPLDEESVLVKIEAELDVVAPNATKDFDPDKYIPQVLEAFSLLHFCPPQHLVEAVKLGLFYKNLLEKENSTEHEKLQAVVMATMNNIRPDNRFENIDLLHEIFNEINKGYNFQLGPALIALSSASQLKQVAALDLPFANQTVKDLISECVDGQDCSHLDDLVQSSGKTIGN